MINNKYLPQILTIGLPLVGSQLLQFLMQVIDTIMLGWYHTDDLSGSVLASSVLFVIVILGSGFSVSVLSLNTKSIAASDSDSVRENTHAGIWIVGLYVLLISPILLFSDSILIFLGQDPTFAMLAKKYLSIYLVGILPALIVMILKSHLLALENSKIILFASLLSIPLNILLNWVLIFGNLGFVEMGIAGASIASVIVQIVTLVGFVVYCKTSSNKYNSIFKSTLVTSFMKIKSVLSLGLPVGITSLAELGMFSAATLIIGSMGSDLLAAHGIIIQITSAVFIVHITLSQVATVVLGRDIGNMDLKGVKELSATFMITSFILVAISTLAFLLIPEVLISAFLGPNIENRDSVIILGSAILAVASLSQLADSSQIIAMGLLRGLLDTKYPMYLAITCYWFVAVPACYLFGPVLGFGGVGVWVGIALGLGLSSVLLWKRFYSVSRQKLSI